MKLLKTLIFSGLLAFASSSSVLAQSQDTPAAREAAAKHYTEVMPMAQMMLDMSQEMTKQMPPDKRDDFIHMMTKEIDLKKLQDAAQESLAKNFTVKELQAMTAFAQSPEGASSMKKMKFYMADIMPVVQSEIKRVVQARAEKASN